jgi:hypothetical protein
MPTQVFQVIYTKEEYMSESLTQGVRNSEGVGRKTYTYSKVKPSKNSHRCSL